MSIRAIKTAVVVTLALGILLLCGSTLLSRRAEPADTFYAFWWALSSGEVGEAREYVRGVLDGHEALLLAGEIPASLRSELLGRWEIDVPGSDSEETEMWLDVQLSYPDVTPSFEDGIDGFLRDMEGASEEASEMRVQLVYENGSWWIRRVQLPGPLVELLTLVTGSLPEGETVVLHREHDFDIYTTEVVHTDASRGLLRVWAGDGELVEIVGVKAFDTLSREIRDSSVSTADPVAVGPAHWSLYELGGSYVFGGTGPDLREYLYFLASDGRLEERSILPGALLLHTGGLQSCPSGRYFRSFSEGEGLQPGTLLYDMVRRELLPVEIDAGSDILWRESHGALWMSTGDGLTIPTPDVARSVLGESYVYFDTREGNTVTIDPGDRRMVAAPGLGSVAFCPGYGRLAFIATVPLELSHPTGVNDDRTAEQILTMDGESLALKNHQMADSYSDKHLMVYCFYENQVIADARIPLEVTELADTPSLEWINSRYVELEDADGHQVFYDLANSSFMWQLPHARARRMEGRFYTEGSPEERQVALTFDDGPEPTYTPQVLDILKEREVPATFFLLGNNMLEWPELVQRIVDEGHAVGNHSLDHSRMGGMPSQYAYENQVRPTQEIFADQLGSEPALFRPPYGEVTDSQIDYLADRGMVTVNWSVDPEDWHPDVGSAEEIVKRVVDYSYEGAIVLLHTSDGPDLRHAMRALPEIITTLKERGYSFVTLPELLGIDENLPAIE